MSQTIGPDGRDAVGDWPVPPAVSPAAGPGDEPQTKTEKVTGFPPEVPPQIHPLTHQDPFPAKPKGGGMLPKARRGDVYLPSNLKLPIGNAASFKRVLQAILEKETASRPGVTVKQVLAEMLVNSALAGDKWAHEQIMDRTDGKPTQVMEVSGKVRNPLEDLSDAQIELLMKLKAQAVEQNPPVGESRQNMSLEAEVVKNGPNGEMPCQGG